MPRSAVEVGLLARRGLVFARRTGPRLLDRYVSAVELELAQLGFAMSHRLREQVAHMELSELADLKAWLHAKLTAHLGGGQRHVPLYRKFPKGTPEDTDQHRFERILVHFYQAPDQPCLFCRRVGTTHVLKPCRHVVCDYCWDGSNFSACPVCEQHVDLESPFFEPTPYLGRPKPERVTFKLLDLGEDLPQAARQLFEQLCARPQVLSPDDRDLLLAILFVHRGEAIDWVPAEIPVRENVATILGVLMKLCLPQDVLPAAKQHLRTATDVLRFIAVYSGADPSLQATSVTRVREVPAEPSLVASTIATLAGRSPPNATRQEWVTGRVRRFQVAKLSRPRRRMLLAVLESFEPQQLVEDMMRHRSYWVWVGEFLHPHEYAKRFPSVARAFRVVRAKGPDGNAAPPFESFAGKVEAHATRRDVIAMADELAARPGVFGRRLDHLLRLAGDDLAATRYVLDRLRDAAPEMSPPILLTLQSVLTVRAEPAAVRVYWPKGGQAEAVTAEDTRPTLERSVIDEATAIVGEAIAQRLAKLPKLGQVIVDAALRDIVVPFNERTASRAALSLPRGSRVAVPSGKTLRLFLHWCEPQDGGRTTDLDLSVSFYDADWSYVGVCSYYELTLKHQRDLIAQSAGDLQSAPFPHGATEFVDVHRGPALARGIRYAVFVVNSYAGMAFDQLERAFAGVMLRDDVLGEHFDPRTVALRFALSGKKGIYIPLVLDLAQDCLHWLDLYRRGEPEMNNVETSRRDIQRVCPDLIGYFASGARASMLDLAIEHAAARTDSVIIRRDELLQMTRAPGENIASFRQRLRQAAYEGDGGNNVDALPPSEATMAVLLRGDIALPDDAAIYALFREQLTPNLGAADLIAF